MNKGGKLYFQLDLHHVLMRSIIILTLSTIPHILNAFCPKQDIGTNNHHQSVKLYIEAKLNQLANRPHFFKEADNYLVKLMAAKSPIIFNWMKKRKFDQKKDEVKIILAWRKYYLQHFIIGGYPKNTSEVNKQIEDLFAHINLKAFPKGVKNKFHRLFLKAKKESIDYIMKSRLSKNDKTIIKKRIDETQLYWFKELKGSKYQRAPLEFLDWGLSYDPITSDLNIGLNSLAYSSDSTLLAVFVHELAHSFDPCRWSAMIGGPGPFEHVIKCLRDPQSAGALTRDDTLMNEMLKLKKIDPLLAMELKKNPTCNKLDYPPQGLQKDQIVEVFADWLSAEVVSHNLENIDLSLRYDLCQSSNLVKGSAYLSNHDRLHKIYLANPKIKKKLKIKNESKYCPL